jgi:lipoprotein-releasing system ATP-binding protein
MSEPVLKVTGLARSFEQGGARIDVLAGVDLSVAPSLVIAFASTPIFRSY